MWLLSEVAIIKGFKQIKAVDQRKGVMIKVVTELTFRIFLFIYLSFNYLIQSNLQEIELYKRYSKEKYNFDWKNS